MSVILKFRDFESLEHYIERWRPDSEMVHPLLSAAVWCNADQVRIVATRCGVVNAVDKTGKGPMHYAVYESRPGVIKLLHDLGVDVDAVDKKGKTPLYLAAMIVDVESAEQLIALNSKGCSMRTHTGRTPLMRLCKSEYFPDDSELFDLLLGNCPELVDAVDDKGWTALHYAVTCTNQKPVELLHAAGSRAFNMRTVVGYAPLHLAAINGDKEMAKLLHRCGSDLDVLDDGGCTPMHIAAQLYDFKPLVMCLIKLGSRAYWMKDNYGKRPRDYMMTNKVDAKKIEQYVASWSTLATLRIAADVFRRTRARINFGEK